MNGILLDVSHHAIIGYLVANAIDLAIATVANDIVMGCLVHLDLNLSGVGDWDECMVLVLGLGQGQASLTQIVVGALEALVSHADDRLQAQITRGVVDRSPLALGSAGLGGRGIHVLFDGSEGMVRMTLVCERVAVLAQIIVGTVLAFPADTSYSVQTDVAIDIMVNSV